MYDLKEVALVSQLGELPAALGTPHVRRNAASGARKLANIAAILLAYQIAVGGGCAQPTSTDSSALRFEVVSVKQSGTVGSRMAIGNGPARFAVGGFRYTPGRLTCNLPLRSLIEEAFSVKSWQVSGPGWLDGDTFDLTATMPSDTNRANARLMLRKMLAERFGLKFHREQREFPVYGLVAGKGGPKLHEVPNTGTYDQTMGAGRFSATAIPITRFADWLSSIADRPVVDMTGIAGVYKVDVRWTPDYETGPKQWDAGIFGAVQQLGLKLESRRAPMEFLVIDDVARVPTAN